MAVGQTSEKSIRTWWIIFNAVNLMLAFEVGSLASNLLVTNVYTLIAPHIVGSMLYVLVAQAVVLLIAGALVGLVATLPYFLLGQDRFVLPRLWIGWTAFGAAIGSWLTLLLAVQLVNFSRTLGPSLNGGVFASWPDIAIGLSPEGILTAAVIGLLLGLSLGLFFGLAQGISWSMGSRAFWRWTLASAIGMAVAGLVISLLGTAWLAGVRNWQLADFRTRDLNMFIIPIAGLLSGLGYGLATAPQMARYSRDLQVEEAEDAALLEEEEEEEEVEGEDLEEGVDDTPTEDEVR